MTRKWLISPWWSFSHPKDRVVEIPSKWLNFMASKWGAHPNVLGWSSKHASEFFFQNEELFRTPESSKSQGSKGFTNSKHWSIGFAIWSLSDQTKTIWLIKIAEELNAKGNSRIYLKMHLHFYQFFLAGLVYRVFQVKINEDSSKTHGFSVRFPTSRRWFLQFLTSFSGGNEFVISAGMSCWYLGSMDYFTPL